ncbi:MAG: trypsin-like peptidase domain-containing protein [Bacteroidetes bacterium]|nr:trypsin-like peptidase domain-containing protein [Bacteroidota bacterium]MDA1242972.1 trypsin-like peptidase domain-containing protein [Bacteroidota bacterium]
MTSTTSSWVWRLVFWSSGCIAGAAGFWAWNNPSKDIHPAVWTTPTPSSPWMASPNSSTSSDANDFVLAANESIDAVVHVQTASLIADLSNPWLSMLGMAQGRVAEGSGSGVIVDSKGLIVTNHHVIEGADRVVVSTSNGEAHEATLLGSDPSTDLAVLQIQPRGELKTLAFGNSDALQVGEWVLAVGNPLNLTSTVTAGIVSAKGRTIRLLEPDASRDVYPVESFIQTDAAVNPGNSGGALVNLSGELIGINTAIASRTGSYAGYSFAIPSSIVQKVVRDLREFGRVQRAYLGIQVEPLPHVVRIASTTRGGGAEAAGLKPGDDILAVNGIPTSTFPSLQEQLSKHRPGDVVSVTVLRNSQRITQRVELRNREGVASAKELASSPPSESGTVHPLSTTPNLERLWESWGCRWSPITESERHKLDIRGGLKLEVLSPGELMRGGIRRGFILLRINGSPVSTMDDLIHAVKQAQQEGQQGVLLEGMYPHGERAYIGASVTP